MRGRTYIPRGETGLAAATGARGVVRPSPARLSRLAAHALAVVFACGSPLFAQQRPNIADDVEGGKKKSAKPTGVRQEADPRTPRAPQPRRRTSQPQRAYGASALAVTFLTDAAGADLYVGRGESGMLKLGRTDMDGRLTASLPAGVHQVVASLPGQPAQRRQIDVRPGHTSFAFKLAERAGADAGGGVSPATPSAQEIFERYLDPRLTDAVGLAEWRAAQAQTAAAYALNSVDPAFQAQALFARGQVFYLGGEYAAAIADFNDAALAMPQSALAFYGLGDAYLSSGQLALAARSYRQALKLNPKLALGYRGVARVLARQGKGREALDYRHRARSLGYSSQALDLEVGRALLAERRWETALQLLAPAARSKPSAEAFVALGDSHAGLKQTAQAAAAYRQAVRHDPNSAAAHYRLGELNYNAGEYRAAAEALERALALDPAGAAVNRGRAREMADKSAAKLGRLR